MEYWQTKLRIGSLQIPRFLGGPLDGLTDEPFRAVTRLFCDQSLLYTEIRHVAAVVNMRRGMLGIQQAMRPINFQMTANSTEYIQRACEIVQEIGVDSIDLNIGCPAMHIIKSGAGSALMDDIPRLTQILNCFRMHVRIPFTVKMRAGFKENNAHIIAKLAQDCGVEALVVHPRLQKQKFRGVPNYAVLAEVKRHVTIPVMVSGGISDVSSAKKVYEQTGIDGFLIGRGQLGKPWLLRQLSEQVQGGSYLPTLDQQKNAMTMHLDLLKLYYGAKGLPLAKRHIGFYVCGKQGSGNIRRTAHSAHNWDKLYEIVNQLT